jgi:hypothetical protein
MTELHSGGSAGFPLPNRPERTAFVRLRKALTILAVDRQMFDEVTGQLKSNSSPVFVTLGAALYLVKMLAASAGSRHWPGLSVW